MIWVDSVSEIDNNSPIVGIPCYSDPVYVPNDILLQANYPLALSGTATYQINIVHADGSLIEILGAGNPYVDIFNGKYAYGNYTNLRFNNFTPLMISAGCFCIQLSIFDGRTLYFQKYTQRYTLRTTSVGTGSTVTISGATDEITLCQPASEPNLCGIPNVIFETTFDCIDAYTGQYYGGTSSMVGFHYGDTPFNYKRRCNIEGYFRENSFSVKRTTSLNCRTQRTEKTETYQLNGAVLFPVWKMKELQNMFLANHLYVNGGEYQSDGGIVFKPLQRLYNCTQLFQMSAEFKGCYEWQVFGCDPVCEAQALFFLFP